MRKNLYEAFTLVEMLIVMGILIILMAVGITAGRFAINRANDVAHQNVVDQIYTALQAYYTDNREFPADSAANTPEALVTDDTLLGKYMDQGAFNGGTAATYYYGASDDQQEVIVCVSKGGVDDDKKLGFYCNGNSFGSTEVVSPTVTSKDVATGTEPFATTHTGVQLSNWDGKTWGI
jgi:type II secretory pathway pseudopilin PulG